MSKYGVFSCPYFPVFSTNTGKYGPEKTPYLDTFHTVSILVGILLIQNYCKQQNTNFNVKFNADNGIVLQQCSISQGILQKRIFVLVIQEFEDSVFSVAFSQYLQL